MSGYTPVFDSVFKGSLYGKWPDTAAWICLLALADHRGHVDITPEAIAGMTGMPLADLLGCIKRFCEPDPRSRSQSEEGRKLVPIDAARDWGWKVVNIQVYRERARDQNRVSDGRNADKLRKWRESRNPVKPGETRATHPDPNSDSDSDSDSDSEKNKKAADAAVVLHESLPKEAWDEWMAHRREKRWSRSPRALRAQLRLLARYDTGTQREIIERSINAGWQGVFDPKGSPAPRAPKAQLPDALEVARRRDARA